MSAAGARRHEVTLMVHDDGPVGLDGVEVVFDDERLVSDAGIALRRSSVGSGSNGSSSVACACAAIGREPRTRVAR